MTLDDKVEETRKELLKVRQEINDIKNRLDSHLQVAELVDESKKEKIQDLQDKFEKSNARIDLIEESIKSYQIKETQKAKFIYFLFKLIVTCGVIMGLITGMIKIVEWMNSFKAL